MDETTVQNLLFDAHLEALREGQRVTLKARGSSMLPFLTGEDRITIVSCDAEKLRPGDIIVFESTGRQNRIIAHRLIWKIKNRDRRAYLTKGDSRMYCDAQLVTTESILGKAVSIEKPNLNIDLETIFGRVINVVLLIFSIGRVFFILRGFKNRIKKYLSAIRKNLLDQVRRT